MNDYNFDSDEENILSFMHMNRDNMMLSGLFVVVWLVVSLVLRSLKDKDDKRKYSEKDVWMYGFLAGLGVSAVVLVVSSMKK